MEQSPLAIHHVGIAVPSIDDAMHFYGDTLGLELVDSLDLPDRQLKVAFVQAANTLIELLEPTDPDSTVSRFLERRGPGLHHLCFGTPDIREHLRDLKDKGVELIDEVPRPGAHGEVAFLQPSAALGVLVELTQPAAPKPAEPEPAAEPCEPEPAATATEPTVAAKPTEPEPAAKATEPGPAAKATEPEPAAKATESDPVVKPKEPESAAKPTEPKPTEPKPSAGPTEPKPTEAKPTEPESRQGPGQAPESRPGQGPESGAE